MGRKTFLNSTLLCFSLPRVGVFHLLGIARLLSAVSVYKRGFCFSVLQPLQLLSFAPKFNQTKGNTFQNSTHITKGLFLAASASKYVHIIKLYSEPSTAMYPAMLDSLSFPVSLGRNGHVTEKIRGEHCFTRELTRNHVHFSDES